MAKNKETGFSLIEVAIGLLVLGLIMVPALHLYNLYLNKKIIMQSSEYPQTIAKALEKYAVEHGRYPRPAARNLRATDAGFGWEDTTVMVPACGGGGETFVCQTVGLRDTAADADVAPDPVYVGDVPHGTLGLPHRFIRDGYANKFTYAVSAHLTVAGTFQDDRGVIRIIDEDGSAANGVADNAHFVVVSHGRDGKGAFGLEGTLTSACMSAAGKDQENCDSDGSFTNNFQLTGVLPNVNYVRQLVSPAGANHYDDYLDYRVTLTSDIWTMIASTDIFNHNSGNVRIGAGPAPAAKVDVNGNARAVQIDTNRLCRNNGAPCPAPGAAPPFAPAWQPNVFTPAVIGGTPNPANAELAGGGIDCGTKVMTGIANVNEECVFRTLPDIGSCPAGLWPQGTNAAGQLDCVPP